MKRFYSMIAMLVAMLCTQVALASTPEDITGSDNVLTLNVSYSADKAKVPVTLYLDNPTTKITGVEVNLKAPVAPTKFGKYDEEEGDYIFDYTDTKRFTSSHSATISAGSEKHPDMLYISIVSSKTTNLKGNEGKVITVYLDCSELADGNYVVSLVDAMAIWSDKTSTNSYISEDYNASFTVAGDKVYGSVGATAVALDENEMTLTEYEGQSLTATVTPEKAYQEVVWSSTDTSVLMVDEEGTFYPVSNGKAAIVATTVDGTLLTDTCKVTVDIPSMFKATTTQSTLTVTAVDGAPEAESVEIVVDGASYAMEKGSVVLTGLAPGTTYTVKAVAMIDDHVWVEEFEASTGNVAVNFEYKATPTSLNISANVEPGDATVTRASFDSAEQLSEINEYRLEPGKTYEYTYYVTTADGKVSTFVAECATTALEFGTTEANVVSEGNVRVSVSSNITASDGVAVGFEWRATDWDDNVGSLADAAFFYEGTLEATIRDLDTDKEWKIRPMYTAKGSKYFYGDWVYVQPTNPTDVDPVIHTFAQTEVEGNNVSIKGYALEGSREVKQQGFKYWEVLPADLRVQNKYPGDVEVPAYAKTIYVNSENMEAELTNLMYEMEYHFVAFATTEEGNTFYGEEQSIMIADPDGVKAATTASNGNVKVYTITGAPVYAGPASGMKLPKGIYIVRPADGKAKKVAVK